MVTFDESSYTITVETPGKPYEDYVETIRQLVDLLSVVDKNLRNDENFLYIHDLVKEMLLTYEQLRFISDIKEVREGMKSGLFKPK